MLSEKPWKADGLILLVAGLLLSMSMGMLLAQALPKLFPSVAELDQLFVRFIISTLSVQGVALVLIHQFFRWHNTTWRELLVSRERSWFTALGTGLLAGLLVIPVALVLLNFVSLELMRLIQLEPEKQTAITVIEKTVAPTQRIWFAFAAIVLAPVVEEVFFRGILYPYLKQRTRQSFALIVTSVLFAAIHFNVMIFIPLVFFGIVLALLYERTDSLITPIATHAVFNATNFVMLIYQDELTRYFRERI